MNFLQYCGSTPFLQLKVKFPCCSLGSNAQKQINQKRQNVPNSCKTFDYSSEVDCCLFNCCGDKTALQNSDQNLRSYSNFKSNWIHYSSPKRPILKVYI